MYNIAINMSFFLFRNEDVTNTIYGSMYPERGESYSPKWSDDKITDICAKLLSELEKDPKRNILPILSCLVRRGGDDGVEAALRRIDRSRRDEAAEATEALDFLLLLVDVNHLFNVALGLYDFELVSC